MRNRELIQFIILTAFGMICILVAYLFLPKSPLGDRIEEGLNCYKVRTNKGLECKVP